MSMPLLKMGIKSNGRLLLLFMGIITIYAGVITAMYDPELGKGINAMAESMPELFAAFGMQNPGITLLDFIINYLYGFILIGGRKIFCVYGEKSSLIRTRYV